MLGMAFVCAPAGSKPIAETYPRVSGVKRVRTSEIGCERLDVRQAQPAVGREFI
jgi:hypothetical protein